MKILLATRALGSPGGTETYLELIASELRQLDHEVVLYAPVGGTTADRLRLAGFDVRTDLADLGDVDVTHVQHASTALRVRARFPDLPMVYVCHSSVIDIEDPPALTRPTVAVAMTDRVAARLRARAGPRVERLRQPVRVPFTDPDVFTLPDRPRYGLLMAHRSGRVEAQLAAACEAVGIELRTVGAPGQRVDDLAPYFMDADVVFAVGRTLVEAMSFGRAAFVIDDRGSDGFVTPTTYPEIEAAGFVRTGDRPSSVELLTEQLAAYEPSFGQAALELVRRNHSSRVHARELVSLYQEAVAAGSPHGDLDVADVLLAHADALEEVFRLTFASRNAEWRRAAMERSAHEHALALEDLRAHLVDLQAAIAAGSAKEAARTAELAARTAQLDAVERELHALRSTRTMRWLRPVRGLYARLR